MLLPVALAEDPPAEVLAPERTAPAVAVTPPTALWLARALHAVEGRVIVRVNVPAPGVPVTTRALVVPVGDTWAVPTVVTAVVPEGDGVAVRFEALGGDAQERGEDGPFDALVIVEPPTTLAVLEPHGLRAADRPVGAGPLDCDVAIDWDGDGRPEAVVYDGAVYRRTGRGRAGWTR